jgi:hypothetical protein
VVAGAAAIPAAASSGTAARGPRRSVTKIMNLAVLVGSGTSASRGEGATRGAAACWVAWTAMLSPGAYRWLPMRPITAAPTAPARLPSSAVASAGVQVYLAARLRLR